MSHSTDGSNEHLRVSLEEELIKEIDEPESNGMRETNKREHS